MDKDAKIMPLWKYTLSSVVGFGLAGAIWGGWDLYGSTPPADYPLTIIGAILLGILGGVGLALPLRSIKAMIWVVLLGLVGAVSGVFAAGVGVYNLPLIGRFVFLVFPAELAHLTRLEPELAVTVYWLNFALAGAFLGLFFALGLKKKVLPMALRGAIGFGLAAIIGPIFGNLIGHLFHSLIVSYLITFLIVGMALGLSLSLRISKKEKGGSTLT